MPLQLATGVRGVCRFPQWQCCLHYFFGQLDLDAGNAQFMVDAISGRLTLKDGPWSSEDVERVLAAHRAGPPR